MSEQEHKQKKNWLEWAVFAISIILTLSVLAYLAYQAIISERRTPTLSIQTEAAQRQQEGQYVMPVEVRNTSPAPAEAIHVEVVLFKGGKEWEKTNFTLQFAPPHSKRKGWVIFSKDPSQADRIEARPLGYQEP